MNAPPENRNRPRRQAPQSLLPKLTKDALPPRAYFTVEQAASIAKCTAADLLHFGGLAKIRLSVAVPPGTMVYSVICSRASAIRKVTEDDRKNGGETGSLKQREVELLSLAPEDCRKIELTGECSQSYFLSGWEFKQLVPLNVGPGEWDDRTLAVGSFVRRFVVHDAVGMAPIRVLPAHVFVMATDFENFLQGKEIVPSGEGTNVRAERPWETELLSYLIQASEQFFKTMDLGQKDTYAPKRDVCKWLVGKGFTQTLAQHADSIIRPAEAKRRGGRPDGGGRARNG